MPPSDSSQRHRLAADMTTAPQETPMPAHDHSDLVKRLEALEGDQQAGRDHRTRVGTLLSLAGAVVLVVVLGAVSVRDTTLATAAKLATLESRVAAQESATSRRDADDRATATAIVRLETTLQQLQATIIHRLDAIDARAAQSPPSQNR